MKQQRTAGAMAWAWWAVVGVAVAGCGAADPPAAATVPEATVQSVAPTPTPGSASVRDAAPDLAARAAATPTPTPLAATATATASAAAATTAAATDAVSARADAGPVAAASASSASAAAVATALLDAPSAAVDGVVHTWQKWNNCGPSAAVMAMSAFGVVVDQLAAAASLKPDREDTNVTPDELAAYIAGHGLVARVRYGAERGRLRALLRAGVPVIVEHWVAVEGRGEMGHYRVVTGYDDATAAFRAADSYYGPAERYGYDAFEAMGRPFLGAYVVVHRPDQAAAVAAALAGDADDEAMWTRVGQAVDDHAARAPGDPWAHVAQGEWRARRGDAAGAVEAYGRARAIGLPFRALWYQFGYAAALYDSGAYDALIAVADETTATMKGENLEEWHVWRGRALAALGRTDEARAAFEHALAFHPGFGPAVAARAALP